MEQIEVMEEDSEMDIKFYESESEDKVVLLPLKQDECCLLCGQLAITYDLEGNVVKRERDDEDDEGQQQQQQHFSFQDLFSFLCRCFKVKKGEWRFNSDSNDLFPFCQMCEFLLVSLAEIYCRLDELEEVLKAKMVEAEEEKFWKEGLYRKHNERYFTFRKHVLKEKFKGNQVTEGVLRERVHSSAILLVVKTDNVSTSAVEIGHSETRQLRTRSCKKMAAEKVPTKSVSSSSEKEESDSDFSSDNDEQVVDMDDLLCNESQSSASLIDTMSDDGTDSDKNFNGKTKKITKPTNKRKSKVSKACSDPLRNRSPRKKKDIKRHARVRNPRKPENSTWRGDTSGYMVTDPETGNITYTTGYGNRFRSTRTVLQFTKLGNKDGYQCCTCLDIVPFESRMLKLQSVFRNHFIRIHSPRYNCRLCQNHSRCSSQEELLQHVVSAHDMDLESYHKAVDKKRLLENVQKRTALRRKKQSLYSNKNNNCEVCQMPFANLERDKIRDHNMSHMNQLELQELEQMDNNLLLIKSYQCHTCGRSFKGLWALQSHERSHANKEHKISHQNLEGKPKQGISIKCEVCEMPFAGLRQREIEVHHCSHLGQEERERKEKELLNPDKETYQCQICPEILKGKIALLVHAKTHADSGNVCAICGEKYRLRKTLDRHMEKVHPGGTWKGPFSCNYPNCSESLDSDSSLLVHVEEEHASSEQARKRIMCLKCGKVLASAWAVKTHGLVHTKERNFHCDICSKTFPLKETLKNHQATMHGVGSKCATFKCEQPGCGAVYRADVCLKKHLRRVHGVYVGKGKKREDT